MRTCKCGKANQPTRKYCIRCGASLIKPEEKETPQESISNEEYQSVITAQKVAITSEVTVSSEKHPGIVEERRVWPSEVSRDRIRTAEKQIGKSELEKAQEAFAKAEEVDIDERMLRASELKELMADGPASLVTALAPEPVDTIPVSEPPVAAPAPQVTTPAPKPLVKIPVPEPQVNAPAPEPLVPTLAPESPDTSTEIPIDSEESTIPEIHEVESKPLIPSPEIPRPVINQHEDKRIREVDSDIFNYRLQIQQLNSELEERRLHYAADVKWLRTVVEQKRIRLQKLEVDIEGAKRDFNEAQKEFREAETLKKHQISEIEKRLSDQDKRIANAEKARDKRLKEIEKEKQASLS